MDNYYMYKYISQLYKTNYRNNCACIWTLLILKSSNTHVGATIFCIPILSKIWWNVKLGRPLVSLFVYSFEEDM